MLLGTRSVSANKYSPEDCNQKRANEHIHAYYKVNKHTSVKIEALGSRTEGTIKADMLFYVHSSQNRTNVQSQTQVLKM